MTKQQLHTLCTHIGIDTSTLPFMASLPDTFTRNTLNRHLSTLAVMLDMPALIQLLPDEGDGSDHHYQEMLINSFLPCIMVATGGIICHAKPC